MHLIEVIPIARGIAKETLSYFSAEHIPEGSVVSVPLRKKTVPALVVSSRDARDARSEIRSSEFAMRKVSQFHSEHFLSEGFIRAARKAAEFYAGSLGSVLSLLVPKTVLDLRTEPPKVLASAARTSFDRLALQADDDERVANYRSFIREEFARKHSVFFCVPTAEDAKYFESELSKGIETHTYTLYGSLPKKKCKDVWSGALADSHPILVIATGPFLALNRSDIGAIIVENESARSYKLLVRPFLDVRLFVEFLAKEIGAKYIVGDLLLRVETLYRSKSGEFADFTALKFRSLSPAECRIVDMRPYKKGPGKVFETISAELSALIESSHTTNQNLFLFAARRGFASQTVCSDCGTVVLCGRCRSPMTLHQEFGKEHFFLCHTCGEKCSAEEKCSYCQSWKLTPLGVGIEQVEAELSEKFPKVTVFKIGADATPTPKKAAKAAADFYAAPGSILLGTEMALPYLRKKFGNAAIASLDALFSIPDFRIHEKIAHLILRIRSRAESAFLVQTRMPEEPVFEYAIKGNLMDFYRQDIASRETFAYPPFGIFIKISLAGNKPAVIREMEKMKELLAPHTVELFPAFSEQARGMFTMHGLIRLPRTAWPDTGLVEKLLTLPPQFRIAVDPESLL